MSSDKIIIERSRKLTNVRFKRAKSLGRASARPGAKPSDQRETEQRAALILFIRLWRSPATTVRRGATTYLCCSPFSLSYHAVLTGKISDLPLSAIFISTDFEIQPQSEANYGALSPAGQLV